MNKREGQTKQVRRAPEDYAAISSAQQKVREALLLAETSIAEILARFESATSITVRDVYVVRYGGSYCTTIRLGEEA